MIEELRQKADIFFANNAQSALSECFKEMRETAIADFRKNGFPTRKHENWRYTPINFLEDINFDIKSPSLQGIMHSDIDSFLLKDIRENYIVTIDGVPAPELSDIHDTGITICSLREALQKYPDLLKRHFGKYAKPDHFTSLNTALFQDGLFIHIPENFAGNSVFHIVHALDVRKKAYLCNTRTLIISDTKSQIKIIESVHNIGDYAGFTNSVTEFYAANDSVIDYYKLQNEIKSGYYVGSTSVALDQGSTFHGVTISLDGKFVRNNLNISLNGENISTSMYGFFFATKDNLIDNYTLVDHAMPKCKSKEIYKGIIDGKSTGVFNGKIIVRPDAQQTDAYQSNKNILLSEDARINSKPQLEIYADDVKCSHGSTTGYLDKESLFYLKSRGISESRAKSLLLNAFASDVLSKIKISALCDEVKSLTAKRLNLDEDLYFCKF